MCRVEPRAPIFDNPYPLWRGWRITRDNHSAPLLRIGREFPPYLAARLLAKVSWSSLVFSMDSVAPLKDVGSIPVSFSRIVTPPQSPEEPDHTISLRDSLSLSTG
jgi:hypothetical protein